MSYASFTYNTVGENVISNVFATASVHSNIHHPFLPSFLIYHRFLILFVEYFFQFFP